MADEAEAPQIALATTAEDLRRFAATRLANQAAADRITRVADAVDGGPGGAQWAGLDLVGAFGRDALPDEAFAASKVAVHSELLRRALWALLIGFTAFALLRAIDAYNQLVAAQPSRVGEAFFGLWQRGFDGTLATPWRLASVAVVDGILLAAFAALGLIAVLRARTVEQRRSDLTGLLVDAWLALNDAPGQVVSAAAQVRDLGASVAAAAREIRGIAADLEGGAREVRGAVDSLGASIGGLDASCGSGSPLARLLADQLEQRADQAMTLQAMQDAARQIAAAADSLAREAGPIAAASKAHTAAADVMADAIVSWNETLEASHRHVVEMTGLAILLERFGEKFQGAFEDLETGLANLLDLPIAAGRELAEAVNRVTETIERFNVAEGEPTRDDRRGELDDPASAAR